MKTPAPRWFWDTKHCDQIVVATSTDNQAVIIASEDGQQRIYLTPATARKIGNELRRRASQIEQGILD